MKVYMSVGGISDRKLDGESLKCEEGWMAQIGTVKD
jgi:hypothetical protein